VVTNMGPRKTGDSVPNLHRKYVEQQTKSNHPHSKINQNPHSVGHINNQQNFKGVTNSHSIMPNGQQCQAHHVKQKQKQKTATNVRLVFKPFW
jgi:hypothetical protein